MNNKIRIFLKNFSIINLICIISLLIVLCVSSAHLNPLPTYKMAPGVKENLIEERIV